MKLKEMSAPIIDINKINEISKQAGQIVLAHYKSNDLKVNQKNDNSPVTSADLASHNYIVKQLNSLYPEIKVISEEDKEKPVTLPEYFWLIDPLDGTKGFISQNDEFSINIALIKNDRPIIGVLYLPVLNILYFASDNDKKAFRVNSKGIKKEIFCPLPESNVINLAINRSLKIPVNELNNHKYKFNILRMSAAGKFGKVAEGSSHIYLRNGPTCEWDTAAGHCIINNSHGKVITLDGKELKYGKKGFLNPAFIALGDKKIPYKEILKELLPLA